ncbi:hypothetical protein SECTIM467_162 [Brevibacillus phage SecTim467]|uniref:Uncharacterized protein n=2 Tax=Jenstvirus jenst TaxID=1982225 RepID=A0A0K2CPE4_9CAUD|nr:hypothetical protein AVV11_gp034 [Brevibacillus phage Jenst]ALA07286.1 hypothetical protein JENST_157 [Brevibacillus phage Jenst]ALA07485.1 hypothetical protein SECTIM467_162 [Brevibacillus phage SecTim467]
MKHTAMRLIPYAVNGVVHVSKVTDPALRRLVKDVRLQPLIRRSLKNIGSRYELLVPYCVDDEEMQFKRRLQLKFGTTVNLSDLKANHRTYYKKLCEYGTPAEILTGWGLSVTYDKTLTEDELLSRVEQRAENGVLGELGRKSKLYQAIAYQARKRNLTVIEYLREKGYHYKGGRANA